MTTIRSHQVELTHRVEARKALRELLSRREEPQLEDLRRGLEAEQLVEFLTKALKPGADGRKRLDKAETRELLIRLGSLSMHVARDMAD